MKYLMILFTTVMAVSCNGHQKLVENKESSTSNTCPDDGICTLEVLEDKSFEIKSDAYGNTYPVISDGHNTLLKFEYKKNEIEGTADSNYSEIIYAEIDGEIKNIALKDTELSAVKLAFGRLCFCRGQTGYYDVRNGSLAIEKINDKEYHFSLEFKIEEVPQVITRVSKLFSL